MLFRHTLVLLALPMALAFGPATPLKGASVSNGNQLSMRVSAGDMKRRSKITTLLDGVVNPGNPVATKAAIESTVLTGNTEALLEKCNWKVRNAMLKKVRDLAANYDITVSPDFGQPMPRLEREALEASQAVVKKAQRKAHFDKINAERDARVEALRIAEAGTEADRKKKAAARAQERLEIEEARVAEIKMAEAEEQRKLMATIANAVEAEKEAEAKEATESEEAEVEA